MDIVTLCVEGLSEARVGQIGNMQDEIEGRFGRRST